MSYTTLEAKIRMLPEECLEEVARYVEYIIFRLEHEDKQAQDLSSFFGSVKSLSDGLDYQKEARNDGFSRLAELQIEKIVP